MELVSLAREDPNGYLHYVIEDVLGLIVRLLRPIEVRAELDKVWGEMTGSEVGERGTYRYDAQGRFLYLRDEHYSGEHLIIYPDPLKPRDHQAIEFSQLPPDFHLDHENYYPLDEDRYLAIVAKIIKNPYSYEYWAYYVWHQREKTWAPLFDWTMKEEPNAMVVSAGYLYQSVGNAFHGIQLIQKIELATGRILSSLSLANFCGRLELDRENRLLGRTKEWIYRWEGEALIPLPMSIPLAARRDPVTDEYYQIIAHQGRIYLVNLSRGPRGLELLNFRAPPTLVDISLDGTVHVTFGSYYERCHYLLR